MIKNLGIVVFILVGLFLAGCDSSPLPAKADELKTEKRAEKTDPVQVIAARQQTISRSIEVTGDVVAANTVVIRSSIDGPVADCPWREGDAVKKGEKLVEIDRPVYQQEVRSAEAALAVARARLAALMAGSRKEEIAQAAEMVKQYQSCTAFAGTEMERTKQLAEIGAIPEENLDKSKLDYIKCKTGLAAAREKHDMLKSGPVPTDVAVQKALVRESEAKLDMAKAKLAECLIAAPFDGVITRVDVHAGDMASAKAPLLTLMETASIVVRFSVPEVHSYKLNEDTPLQISLDALPNESFDARIVRVYPEIDPRTRTRIMEAIVDDYANLVPGMFARITLTTESSDAGVVVPDRALLTTSAGGTVAFVSVNETAEQRKVKIGIENGSCVQVIEGILPGEMVIVAGHEKIKNGTRIKAEALKEEILCARPENRGRLS